MDFLRIEANSSINYAEHAMTPGSCGAKYDLLVSSGGAALHAFITAQARQDDASFRSIASRTGRG
jgi:hypothetical protein